MRILLVSDFPADPTLGSAKVSYKLREEFERLGHHCDCLFREDLGPLPENDRLRLAASSVLAARAVLRAFRKSGPYDVVDAASAEGFVLGLLRRFGFLRRTSIVARSNGLEHLSYRRLLEDHAEGLIRKPWTRRWWFPLVRLPQVASSARTADALIVLNSRDRQFVLKRGWKRCSDVQIVPHGVSKRFLYRAPEVAAPRGKGALFCGTWTNAKGTAYLVDALRQLFDAGFPLRLTILGGGYPEQHIRKDFSPQLQHLLTILPRVPEEQVIANYRSHDLLVFPSTYEGFGLVVIEAMSQGLPVVTTPVGCVPDMLCDGQTALIVPPRDSRQLASAIQRLLEDVQLRKTLAARAEALVCEMSWTRTARRTLEIYQQAIARRAVVPSPSGRGLG